MTTEQTQRDHDQAAHERLADIRSTLGCAVGEEAIAARRMDEQYRLCREQLDQIEREAASEEAEHIARAKAFVDSLRDAVAPLKVGQA